MIATPPIELGIRGLRVAVMKGAILEIAPNTS